MPIKKTLRLKANFIKCYTIVGDNAFPMVAQTDYFGLKPRDKKINTTKALIF